VWRSTAVMYGAMAFVHVLLITAAGGAGHAGHAGAGPPVAGWTVAGMWAGLALAGVQVVLAGTVLAAGRVQLPPGEVTVARPG